LRLLDKSKVIRAGLGDDLINAFVKLKLQEWDSYGNHLSSWERNNTLDC